MTRRKPSTGLCYRAFEFRSENSDGNTLEGLAAVFNQPARIDSWEGEFDEVFEKGAFAKTLKERTPVLQFDHGRDARTGSVPIGSFEELKETDEGLFYRAPLFDNDVVKPIRQAIEGGAIDGCSIRFRVIREDWADKDGKSVPASELPSLLFRPGERGPLLRTIKEAELFELGPVVFPAYEGTTVGVRSLLASLEDSERAALVRELAQEIAGLSSTTEESSDAAPAGTSEDAPDAGRKVTSGAAPGARSAALRALHRERS